MLTRWIKEPILHFLLIGTVIFGIFFAIEDPAPKGNGTNIVVNAEIAGRLAAQFQASWRRRPNPDELDGLIDAYIQEEVLVREALAMSLDTGDTVIRQRLQQKMKFLAKSAAAAVPTDEAELEAFFSKNAARYAKGGTLAFEQVFLGAKPSGAEIAKTLEDLVSGRDPLDLGAPTLLPFRFPPAGQQKIDGTLGPGVYVALTELEPGVWGGPIQTGYGLHLARVTEHRLPEVPDFDSVRGMVELDWRANFEEKLTTAQFEQMRARYAVKRPHPDEIEAILE